MGPDGGYHEGGESMFFLRFALRVGEVSLSPPQPQVTVWPTGTICSRRDPGGGGNRPDGLQQWVQFHE